MSELAHHGILGQRWGVRRYQNPDGTLTDEGRKRLQDDLKNGVDDRNVAGNKKQREKAYKDYEKSINKLAKEKHVPIDEMDGTEVTWQLAEILNDDYVTDRMWNSFIDKYAEATLKDLEMRVSKDALEYAKELLDGEKFYLYDHYVDGMFEWSTSLQPKDLKDLEEWAAPGVTYGNRRELPQAKK